MRGSHSLGPLLTLLICLGHHATLGSGQHYGNGTSARGESGLTGYAKPTVLRPTAFGQHQYWSQIYSPVLLGTVYVVVNQNNKTEVITRTNSSAVRSNTNFLNNGTLKLLTRTDVNEAGTVTVKVNTGLNATSALAYPTPYFTVRADVVWEGYAISGYETDSNSEPCCCGGTVSASPPPQHHHSWPASTGSTNPNDPRGWLFGLTASTQTYRGYKHLSSLFEPASIHTVTQPACRFCNACDLVSPAEAAQIPDGGLLTTETVHITSHTATATPASTVKGLSSTTPPSQYSTPSSPVDPIQATSSTGASSNIATTTSGRHAPPVSLVSAHSNILDSTASYSPEPDAVSPAQSTRLAAATSSRSGDADTSSFYVTTSPLESMASPPYSSAGDQSTPEATALDSSSAAQNAASVVLSILGYHHTTTVTTGSSQTADSSTIQLTPGTYTASSSNEVHASPDLSSQGQGSIDIGSTTLAMLPVALTTSLDGSATTIPGFTVGSQTHGTGSTFTVSDTLIVIQTSDGSTYAVVAGVTNTITAQTDLSQATLPPLTVGSSTFTANSNSEYVIGSQTLSPEAAITAIGTTYSLAAGGTEIIAGSSTEVLTSVFGMASYIWDGLGGAQSTQATSTQSEVAGAESESTSSPATTNLSSTTSTNITAPQAYTGAASRALVSEGAACVILTLILIGTVA